MLGSVIVTVLRDYVDRGENGRALGEGLHWNGPPVHRQAALQDLEAVVVEESLKKDGSQALDFFFFFLLITVKVERGKMVRRGGVTGR